MLVLTAYFKCVNRLLCIYAFILNVVCGVCIPNIFQCYFYFVPEIFRMGNSVAWFENCILCVGVCVCVCGVWDVQMWVRDLFSPPSERETAWAMWFHLLPPFKTVRRHTTTHQSERERERKRKIAEELIGLGKEIRGKVRFSTEIWHLNVIIIDCVVLWECVDERKHFVLFALFFWMENVLIARILNSYADLDVEKEWNTVLQHMQMQSPSTIYSCIDS